MWWREHHHHGSGGRFVRCSQESKWHSRCESLYPNEWKVDSYLRLLVNADTLERVKRGESAQRDRCFVESVDCRNSGARESEILLY